MGTPRLNTRTTNTNACNRLQLLTMVAEVLEGMGISYKTNV